MRDALGGPGGGADAELSVLQRLARSSLGPLQLVGRAAGNAAVRGPAQAMGRVLPCMPSALL